MLMFEDEDADWVDIDDIDFPDGEGPDYEVTGTELDDSDERHLGDVQAVGGRRGLHRGW